MRKFREKYFDIPSLNLCVFFFQVMKKYSLLQSNYVALLGPSQNAEQLLKELIQFEKDLAKVCLGFLFLKIQSRVMEKSYGQRPFLES